MGIFEEIFEFRTLKGHEAQGQFRGEILILDYASTLLMNTFLAMNCLGNLCTKGGRCDIISTLPKIVSMKIKAPSFADLFAETSPQLGGARRTKFLEIWTVSFLGRI